MKKYIGRLIKMKFKDMGPLVGHVLDYSDDWILLRNCPVDYVVDGYFVVRNRNIKEVVRGEDEKWREKVIGLKKLKGVPKIALTDLNTILKTLTKKYGVFSVHTKDDDVCWLGRLNRIEDKHVIIDDLTPKAKWEHNDYVRLAPFYTAYSLGVGYMEADIFLVGDELLVAHHRSETDAARALAALYLEPLSKQIAKNRG